MERPAAHAVSFALAGRFRLIPCSPLQSPVPDALGAERARIIYADAGAGFVEDTETLAKLEEMGVDCVQGYLIGKPKPLSTLG